MSRESLILEFHDASAPMRQAATEEVVIRRFGGIGPEQPRITRITVEYDDPRVRPESVNSVSEAPRDRLASGFVEALAEVSPDEFAHSLSEPRGDEWAV